MQLKLLMVNSKLKVNVTAVKFLRINIVVNIQLLKTFRKVIKLKSMKIKYMCLMCNVSFVIQCTNVISFFI